MLKSLTKHREVTGPTSHNVAILAKPTNKRPAEYLILERRRIEELREISIADSKFHKQTYLRSQWEKSTDKQIQKNTIKKEVEKHISYENILLQKRRERLREMLLQEEEQFIFEMESTEETMEDRHSKMKERAKFLKGKREQEKEAFVAEKLEQKFRNECEELRSVISKQTRDDIFKDREEQIRMKGELKEREEETERFYAGIWESDRLAKAVREELETKEQIERSKSALQILNLQMKASEVQREEEKVVKRQEAEWLIKEAESRALEDELMKKEKKEKERADRRERDFSLKLKAKKDAKEKQEEIAIDMKMMEKILQDTENQAVEYISKKKSQREEMQRFMHYVDKVRLENEAREKHAEELICQNITEQWKKKDARKRLEKAARKTLMQNVIETREIQRKEREEIMRTEKQSAMKERKELLDQIEENKCLENERILRIRQENLQYQNDLEEQIKYQRAIKEKEIQEARKELETMHKAENSYQRRLRSALTNPQTKEQHPFYVIGKRALNPRVQSC